MRVSDVMQLKKSDVFTADGTIKQNTVIQDQKTRKVNTLYLKPVHADLLAYYDWLQQQNLISEWLFPSIQHPAILPKNSSTKLWQRLVIS